MIFLVNFPKSSFDDVAWVIFYSKMVHLFNAYLPGKPSQDFFFGHFFSGKNSNSCSYTYLQMPQQLLFAASGHLMLSSMNSRNCTQNCT
jgi:hypothetical protein